MVARSSAILVVALGVLSAAPSALGSRVQWGWGRSGQKDGDGDEKEEEQGHTGGEEERSSHAGKVTATLGRVGGAIVSAGGSVVGGVSRIMPKWYGCQVETKLFGTLDRWVAVQPELETSKELKKWVSYSEWQAWIDGNVLDIEQQQAQPNFTFSPFVLRKAEQYLGKHLLRTVKTSSSGGVCIADISVVCHSDYLALAKATRCDSDAETTELHYFGSATKSVSFCPYAPRKTKPWGKAWGQYVFVMDGSGEYQPVTQGSCASISVLDPSFGISLGKLNSDMLGEGLEQLASNTSKTKAVMHKLKGALVGIYKGVVEVKDQVVEGGQDAIQVVNTLNEDLASGSEEAKDKSVKWIKRLALASMVDTCLCCDQEVVDKNVSMAKHCMVAYTLGGQNKSQTLKYTLKTAAGTLYNLAKMAGGWLVPFIGGNLVEKAQEQACSFSCSLREPNRFEPFAYGQVRKIPGLALQTWFIPNPTSFYSAATGATAAADNIIDVVNVVDDVI